MKALSSTRPSIMTIITPIMNMNRGMPLLLLRIPM